MSFLVQPRLVNGPFGDPAVFLHFRHGRRAMLFDLGDLGPLSPREILRVSHAFVSHAHMDHVAGLDRMLRVRLHAPEPLSLIGPSGFIDRIEHRLKSYTWNLLDTGAVDFRLRVAEFEALHLARAAEFRARDAFARRDLPAPSLPAGVILAEPVLTVEARVLDHGTPSLAFALREALQVNVWREGLDALGLPVGPWLTGARDAARRGLPDTHRLAVPDGREVTLGLLREQVLRIAPGRLTAYVTDAADTAANRARIAELGQDADHLFIEAVFLAVDRHLAEATHHLTAGAAGEIARTCGVRRITLFHHSARYMADPDALAREVASHWRRGAPAATPPAAVPLRQPDDRPVRP